MKKYEMTNECIEFEGKTLYRIKALKDFGNVCAGDLGGFIETEKNLSQNGNCWITGNAKVFEDASVREDAVVYEDATVYGHAEIYSKAAVYWHASVFGYADVRQFAMVGGNAKVYDHAEIGGLAIIRDNSRVGGNAKVYDHAVIEGEALLGKNAVIAESMNCKTGVCKTNLLKDLEESIRVQTGLIPFDGKVIAYKQVKKGTLDSFYDLCFYYEVGKWAVASNPDESNASCAKGLHFSNANYWNCRENILDSTFLIAEIRLEDIITVQGGKIRCRRAFILGKYDVKENSNE